MASQASWGQSSARIEDFHGDGNPCHLARMTDGRLVTSEKGRHRIKVYSSGGVFLGLVAGTKQLGEGARGMDVATDGEGRVLVLDPRDRSVRVFEAK